MQDNLSTPSNSTNTEPAVPVVAPQPIYEKPKTNNFLVILLSILLFISVVIAVFFAYQNQKLVAELAVKTSEPEAVFPMYTEPTPDPALGPDPAPIEILTKDWMTYNDTKFNYLFKFPETWIDQTSVNDKNLGNFSLKSNEDEWITGTVFTGTPDLENDKKNGGSSHSYVLNDQKYLFVVYSECMGPGCGVSKKYLDTFNQILATFKFTN